MPEKIEVEVQTNDPDKNTQTDDLPVSDKQKTPSGADSPTSELRKCLHEREAIIMLLQAEVDRQANELNYLRSGEGAGSFRRAKSFSARDRKTFVSFQNSHLTTVHTFFLVKIQSSLFYYLGFSFILTDVNRN